MTSIKDVAREVGMSTATVSRALRGLPRVSEDTRLRVLKAAERLDYVASPAAAGLVSGQTRAVGVVVPFVTRWFYGSVVHGAEELLRERGYDLLLYNLAGDQQARHRVFQTHLLRKRVDAVLILSLTPSAEEIASLNRLDRPVATVGAVVPGFSSVSIDDLATARTAVQHLVDLGHRRIGYIGGDLEGQLDFSAPLDRLRGYREAMAAARLRRNPAWEVTGDFTVRGGLAATRLLLATTPRPTAIFAASDEMAIGAVHAVRETGLRVPEDVSVIGIDDHEMAEFFELSTVAQPVHEQGRVAAQLLLQAIEHGPAFEPAVLTVPTRLVVRRTTAPPRH
ncbi:LacI family DNA-binding transcriptional regulator [Nocardioides mesophilus]|uniref:LacI family DNA-binding transcriptional regulator n=1 Tax=Nocardioides mesophilus TaxID=433659 RepID=A0A7G9RF40_9ACTN|nr:LacI family DNA-binding transcriptional regulator [Nocardioides mesophilus]QNN54215.1 LacI family DNA-binding transcriptional regulator [Nocardioides mesophilus]